MYSESFYSKNTDLTLASAEKLVSFIVKVLNPVSVVDVGSAIGLYLREFKKRGINDILGIEGDWVSEHDLLVPPEYIVRHDLTRPFSLGRRFDVAICLEVAEHLNPSYSNILVSNLSELSDVLVFSAAVPGQGGTHHVNEQWPIFWSRKFAREGYSFVDVRPYIWNDEEILPWYKQNLILYVKEDKKELITTHLPKIELEGPLSLIHPHNSFSLLYDTTQKAPIRAIRYLETIFRRIIRYRILIGRLKNQKSMTPLTSHDLENEN